ncbi:sensor histidine kinase [Shewanella youngdeokensis]|uniref:histidine kinase n=1 Tax=Shewanella youngdeokensis TaxID=2999068 RepID=A0ABZ0JUE7_9GAMM|nr:sensor histidine kinase [Shewanella sp. DAU334]
MQLSFKPKKRLLTRMFLTSLSIIALVGFGLAWMVNILHAQNSYNVETSQLIAEIPKVAAELREHDMLPNNSDEWLAENTTSQRYIIASCDSNFNQVWTSSLAAERQLFDTCENFNDIRESSPPYQLSLADERDYFAYLLTLDIAGGEYNLLVLKDAEKIKAEYNQFSRRTYLRLGFVLALALVLLISAAYWGMRPLMQLRNELQSVNRGETMTLSEGYPVELEAVTQSLNQLLNQSSSQQQRYQNAMNDLAHSLKTRLAAVHAITDDPSLDKETTSEKIMQQVSQMDLLVKYQLKRAMLGRKGLKQQQTKIQPLVDQLAQMLFKVYSDKQVQFEAIIDQEHVFPGDKGDLMELCGNLMENAFKLCISTVRVSSYYNDNGEFELLVEDDGPGVDASIKQNIIQRGVRADTQKPGQGIGLAVCNEVVSSYGGRLSIETSSLEGACFRISIPI